MNLSPFFEDLSGSYGFEIEDLTFDSAGENVLKSRLKTKRNQLDALLAMASTDPVMVAPVFHGAFRFVDRKLLDRLVASQPDEFPAWSDIHAALEMDHWAEALIERVLKADGGEDFMKIAVGLEYIESGPASAPAGVVGHRAAEEDEELDEDGDFDGEGDGDSFDEDDEEVDRRDLGDAGEDWLDDQGFDRRG
jgi:hypothetical protein